MATKDEVIGTYDEKLSWSRFNGIFNIIIGSPKNDYHEIVEKRFQGEPHFVISCLYGVVMIFEDIGKPSLARAYQKEFPSILAGKGLEHHLLNTGVETFDLNLFFC